MPSNNVPSKSSKHDKCQLNTIQLKNNLPMTFPQSQNDTHHFKRKVPRHLCCHSHIFSSILTNTDQSYSAAPRRNPHGTDSAGDVSQQLTRASLIPFRPSKVSIYVCSPSHHNAPMLKVDRLTAGSDRRETRRQGQTGRQRAEAESGSSSGLVESDEIFSAILEVRVDL